MEQAQAILEQAMRSGQLSAAVSALKKKGILSGKRIERAEIGTPGEFDHLTDSELLAAIRERFTKLDRATQLAISGGSIALNGAETDITEGS
jgi:uncharacterized protein (DUF2461 family)